jgi:hypothetical protein
MFMLVQLKIHAALGFSLLVNGLTFIIIIIIVIIIQHLGRFGRNQSPVRRPVWLWYAAF